MKTTRMMSEEEEEEMVLKIASWWAGADHTVTIYGRHGIESEFGEVPTTVIERAAALAVNIRGLWGI